MLDSIRTIVPEHLIGEMKNFLYHEAKLRYNLDLDIDHFDIFLPHVSVVSSILKALLTTTPMKQVPQQPNSCDCGLYTIHFAQVFASDPDFYAALIEVCVPISVFRHCYSTVHAGGGYHNGHRSCSAIR